MKFIAWIKNKYTQRRGDRDNHDPWWVTLMLDVGRPLVAIMILVMCAPGEHYLMTEARFHDPFAWLGPATLTAYAGIAAVTATKRPKGAPGRKTAIFGAIVSIMLAMAAQPISHLWGQHALNAQKVWLIIVVSSVPSAVFGHLLHMGAVPKPASTPELSGGDHGLTATQKTAVPAGHPSPDKGMDAGQNIEPDNAPAGVSVYSKIIPGVRVSSPDVRPDVRPDVQPDTGQDSTSDGQDSTSDGQDTRTDRTPDIEPDSLAPVVSLPVRRPDNVRQLKRPTLSADVRAYLSGHPDADDSDLAAAMAVKWPEAKWDSVRKARDRYQEKKEITP